MIYECEELLGASENLLSWFEGFFKDGNVCPTCDIASDNSTPEGECEEGCATQALYTAIENAKKGVA